VAAKRPRIIYFFPDWALTHEFTSQAAQRVPATPKMSGRAEIMFVLTKTQA